MIAFNAVLLASMASPGPALLLALRTTLVHGSRAGIRTGLGLGLVAALWTACGLLGLDVVFALFPWAFFMVKTCGALYLLYLAWGIWRDARKPLPNVATTGQKHFLTGMLVNLSNPKSVLFAASVLVVIFPPDLSLLQKSLIVLNHLVVEWIVYTCFAALLATPAARAGYLRLKPLFDRAASAMLGFLGLRLLIGK